MNPLHVFRLLWLSKISQLEALHAIYEAPRYILLHRQNSRLGIFTASTHKGWGTQSQKGVRPDMLWPLSAIHVHTSAIGKTRPCSGPHGGRRAEHERDGGRSVH